LQPKINIPEFLSASEIRDVIYASDSELAIDEDEPDNTDLLKKKSEDFWKDISGIFQEFQEFLVSFFFP
jgi:hypothetical protein